MEQKKNNALEKVEQICNKEESDFAFEKCFNTNWAKEQSLADERVEKARLIEQEKAQKQKEKVRAQREKNKKKEQQRVQKQAQKEAHKHENKKERERRVRIEKAGKRDNGSKKGWLTAVICLGIATLLLSSVLTFTLLMPSAKDNMLEGVYQKSFYDTVEQIDNIDLNLSKALATKDTGALQRYLVNTAINSELAENDIQQLPLQDQSKFYTTKIINQIGDFSKSLNEKLIDGQPLTSKDVETLSTLYRYNLEIKKALQNTLDQMGFDHQLSSMIGGGDGDLIISNFNELQNLSVQYPELIYDGPFSDGQNDRQIKGLTGAKINKDQAVQLFKKSFGDMNVTNVMAVGETTGDIECFNVQGQIDGDILYAQYSKQGGHLVMFSYAGTCSKTVYDDDVAIEKAQEFLKEQGATDMKPVWINLANNVYTINFAYEKAGVIIYPDLIKVRVCSQTAKVIGMEAKSYYTNHVERVLPKPTLSENSAKKCLSENIEVDSVRLALVPVGTKTEVLCYEFFGTYDNSSYYIYIDAVSGKQVEMFKVVSGTEGQLLI